MLTAPLQLILMEEQIQNAKCAYSFDTLDDDDVCISEFPPLNQRNFKLKADSKVIECSKTQPIAENDDSYTETLGTEVIKSTNNLVGFVHSENVLAHLDKLPKISGRASMVYKLIEAYGLLKYTRVLPSNAASETEMSRFHSADYLEFLKQCQCDEEGEEVPYNDETQEFGLSYDCPVFPDLFDYSCNVAGSTLTAAAAIVTSKVQTAINWYGGWHHALKDSASGFCYVNDIVLGILKLQEKFQRVLYVDLDLHHGDGVQDAFCATSKVMTISFHKFSPGFFPGTGKHEEIGIGRGKGYSLNVPLKDGIQDHEYTAVFMRIMDSVKATFCPDAVVCQCGADGLAGDPMESFNLTPLALGRCVFHLKKWSLPLLLVGGGGYHHCNTARCWAFLTAVILNKKLPPEIPDHEYFDQYGPTFELGVDKGNMRNQNNQKYLEVLVQQVLGVLQKLP